MEQKKRNRLSSIFSLGTQHVEPRNVLYPDDARSETSSAGRRSPSPGPASKLQKSVRQRDRTPSEQLLSPLAYSSSIPAPPFVTEPTADNSDTDDYDTPLPPPPPVHAFTQSRSSSPDFSSRPGTPLSRPVTPTIQVQGDGLLRAVTPTAKEPKPKKRNFLGFSRGKSRGDEDRGPLAWVVGHEGKVPYNVSGLLGLERAPELWDDNGDTFVYLFPRTSGKGPSFRIDSSTYASSPALTRLAYGDIYSSPAPMASDRRQVSLESATHSLSLAVPTTPPMTPKRTVTGTSRTESSIGSRSISDTFDDVQRETHLYLPIALSTDTAGSLPANSEPNPTYEDMETVVAVRNLFAFLVGQSLVATENRPSLFSIFMKVSSLLQMYEFSNLDGSTYGEAAATSFDNYVEELHLADVRFSRENTIEGIVLGEKMRSVLLYNEAFVHAVGKYDEILKIEHPKFKLISPVTRNRMERALMDLYTREKSVRNRLEDFDFPAIFSGIMNSKTADERKIVRFDQWKASFMTTRKYIMSFYKHRYGSWPPKASSKKNDLETSGLNRLVLRDVYHDFSDLYDLLVDRSNLTTRSADISGLNDNTSSDGKNPTARAMRHVLSEYDRSSPPVQPPVPFDVPLLPSLATTRKDFGVGDAKKDAKARLKKIKDDEIINLLKNSHNPDARKPTPFLQAFADLERKEAHGCTIEEMCDLRNGQWIFMYAVLESLPMLVVDAPGVKWTQGVEYFLCEPPRSGVPWAREDTGIKKSWYGVAGSSGVVNLPSDIVEHGVEGVYRRSHCWLMAERWSAGDPMLLAAVAETFDEEGLAPPVAPGLQSGSRPGSPTRRGKRDSVVMLGLEALPLPVGVSPTAPTGADSPRLRPQAHNDPSKTFDAILETMPAQVKGKKKR
ncbi:hypothetical protein B0A49_01958 [Cryomyces minteri]|nr:hypothetical protein B0A49_01908 [Cryomyces minteri]TKA80207.1 hypothetical protein B0A49_01958 [Cryomyces minteri]